MKNFTHSNMHTHLNALHYMYYMYYMYYMHTQNYKDFNTLILYTHSNTSVLTSVPTTLSTCMFTYNMYTSKSTTCQFASTYPNISFN